MIIEDCNTCEFEDLEGWEQPCRKCLMACFQGELMWKPKITLLTAKDDGKTTPCYDIPEHAKTLDDLIEHKNMPFWLGTMFKVCYAFEERSTRNAAASQLRELNKLGYYQKRGLDLLTKENIPCKMTNETN